MNLTSIFIFGLVLVICPVDQFSELAESIKENIWNYKYDDARSDAQKMINLADQVEEQKIKEDNSNLNMYN